MKKIIFDTDIGGDCDDVLALDVLMACDKTKRCELLGVMYSANLPSAVGCTYAIMDKYGYSHVPIGKAIHPESVIDRTETRSYAFKINKMFKNESTPDYDSTESAVRLYRRLLSDNKNVTIVLTGWLTNLSDLLKSEPDDISPLSGIELVKMSVDEIVMVAGSFSHENCVEVIDEFLDEDGRILPLCEANVSSDIPAAKYVFENCPVPIFDLPCEVGLNMFSGKSMCDAGLKTNSPDALSFKMVGFENGRCSWDPATALYGVFGALPWFFKSAKGTISVDDNGITYFTTANGGMHTIVMCAKPKQEIAAEIDRISMWLYQ